MSKASNRNISGMQVAAAFVLLLILAAFAYYFKLIPFSITGTTLSLSPVSIVNNDKLQGEAWLGTISANNGGENFVGTFQPTDTAFSNVNDKPNQSFTISITNMQEACQYPIYKTSNYIKHAWVINVSGYNPIGCIGGCFDPNNWCRTQHGGIYGGGSSDPLSSQYYYWCAGFNNIGVPGGFTNIIYTWNATLQVSTADGKSVSDVISSYGGTLSSQSSVLLKSAGTPTVWAGWAGNLVNGQSCTDRAPINSVVPVYNANSQSWTIADLASYNTYQTDIVLLTNCLAASPHDYQNCWTTANANTMNLYADKLVNGWNVDPNFYIADMSHATGSTPYAQLNLGLIQYPVISMEILANWVGINKPCGNPSITQYDGSLSGTAVKDTLTGTATVLNSGGNASFGASFSCPSGISGSVSPVSYFNIPSGSTAIVSYSATASQQISGQCTLSVYDVSHCSTTVTKPVWVAFARYCPVTCTGNFVLDPNTCTCVCTLNAPPTCYTIDTNNCVYAKIPNCGGGCALSCPDRYAPNSACNGCVCALDPNQAPSGQFLNTTACQYQNTNNGGSTGPNWTNIAIAIVALVLIIAGLFYMLGNRRK